MSGAGRAGGGSGASGLRRAPTPTRICDRRSGSPRPAGARASGRGRDGGLVVRRASYCYGAGVGAEKGSSGRTEPTTGGGVGAGPHGAQEVPGSDGAGRAGRRGSWSASPRGDARSLDRDGVISGGGGAGLAPLGWWGSGAPEWLPDRGRQVWERVPRPTGIRGSEVRMAPAARAVCAPGRGSGFVVRVEPIAAGICGSAARARWS